MTGAARVIVTEPDSPEEFIVEGEHQCRVDATSAESGSSSGPASQPSEPHLSSLVRALEAQTAELRQLSQSILQLAIAAEHSAAACMVVVDSLAQDDEEDDTPRDLSGRPIPQ